VGWGWEMESRESGRAAPRETETEKPGTREVSVRKLPPTRLPPAWKTLKKCGSKKAAVCKSRHGDA